MTLSIEMPKLKNIIGNVFHSDEKAKAAEQQKSAQLQQKTDNVFGTKSAKNYITEATRLSATKPSKMPQTIQSSSGKDTYHSNLWKSFFDSGKRTATNTGNKTQTTPNTGNKIADMAQKYLGTPYVWGGESMEEGGMDCSGFVYNALKDAGYDVGRTTAQGYRGYGTSVSKADMQPGDLIFYGKNGNASHIGIYLGNGQVIHSSGGSKNTKSNPGKGVVITNVDHRSDFIEARRY